MRLEALVALGAIAAVAAVGVVKQPGTAAKEAPPQGTTAQGASSTQKAATFSCGPMGGPGQALVEAHLGKPLVDLSVQEKQDIRARILIATVPDPVDSGLSWAYDAITTGLRSGLESCGYVLDRQSLPWFDEKGHLVERTGQTALWQEQPGALLFREAKPGARGLVLVYLVGESPTRGIARDAFHAALHEREELLTTVGGDGGDRGVVRIIGPTFSGSSRSLRRVLERFFDSDGIKKKRILILSGGATSLSNVKELTGRDPSPGDCNLSREIGYGVTFCATVHPDPDLHQAFAETAKALFPGRRARVVNFYESTTSYGQQLGPPVLAAADGQTSDSQTGPCQNEDDGLGSAGAGGGQPREGNPGESTSPGMSEVPFPFPMAISVLRAADQTEESTSGQSAPALWAVREVRAQLALSEVRPSVDLPLPASSLAPAYLDVVVSSMVRTARHARPQLAGILATDIRDKIFLASVLHHDLPDLRLYTFESNLLLLWPELAGSLRGMLVFTTYPLGPEVRELTAPHAQRSQVHFLMEAGEGVFNATRLHLRQVPLLDYRTPTAEARLGSRPEQPPVWVAVVGRESLVPLRAFPTGAATARGYVASVCAGPSEVDVQGGLGTGTIVVLLVFGLVGAVLAISSMRQAGRRGPDSKFHWARVLWVDLAQCCPEIDERGASESAGGRARRVALRAQEEFSTAAVLLTLACIVLPLPLLCLGWLVPTAALDPPWDVSWYWPYTRYWLVLVAAIAMGAVAVAGAGAAGLRATRLSFLACRPVRAVMSGDEGPGRKRERLLWRLEFVSQALVNFTALSFLVLLIWTLLVVRRLVSGPNAVMEVFFQRLVALDSGVSPLLPLMLIALLLLVTFGWNLLHLRALRRKVAIELCTEDDAEQGGRDALRCAAEDGHREDDAERQLCPFFRRVAEVRDRVYFLMPDMGAALLVSALLIAAALWWNLFGPTLEPIAFAQVTAGRPFDILLRLGVLVGFALIAWFGYRFASAWSAFRSALSALCGRPIVKKLEPIGPRPCFPLLPWARGRQDSRTELEPPTARAVNVLRVGASSTSSEPTGKDLSRALEDAELQDQGSSSELPKEERLAIVLRAVLRFLTLAGAFRRGAVEPAATGKGPTSLKERLSMACDSFIKALANDKASTDSPHAETGGREAQGDARQLRPGAEAFFAAQLAVWCRKVSDQLWMIAVVAFALWIVMSLLVSSYPHVAPSVVRGALALELAALIVVFIVVTFQMSRDPVLSAIAGSREGRFSLDPATLFRILTLVVTPFLALLGTEVTAIRGFLDSSLFDILKMLTQ